MSSRYPEWERDGRDWPNRAASRFVLSDGYRWHVQQTGEDRLPTLLLLHGTGAATHSWRDLLPLLEDHFQILVLDLPGHGFTRPNLARKASLTGIAHSVGILLDDLALTPDLIVGHSAGVAIAAQLLLDRQWRCPLVGFTPALMPFPGLAARLFPSLAKALFVNPFVGVIVSRLAGSPAETAKFLRRATGSQIDAEGIQFYARLFGTSGHCDGAIRMMASWQLEPLRDRLGELTGPVLLAHAERDKAIAKADVLVAAGRISQVETRELAGLGHLAHEENPALAARIILEFAQLHIAA